MYIGKATRVVVSVRFLLKTRNHDVTKCPCSQTERDPPAPQKRMREAGIHSLSRFLLEMAMGAGILSICLSPVEVPLSLCGSPSPAPPPRTGQRAQHQHLRAHTLEGWVVFTKHVLCLCFVCWGFRDGLVGLYLQNTCCSDGQMNIGKQRRQLWL